MKTLFQPIWFRATIIALLLIVIFWLMAIYGVKNNIRNELSTQRATTTITASISNADTCTQEKITLAKEWSDKLNEFKASNDEFTVVNKKLNTQNKMAWDIVAAYQALDKNGQDVKDQLLDVVQLQQSELFYLVKNNPNSTFSPGFLEKSKSWMDTASTTDGLRMPMLRGLKLLYDKYNSSIPLQSQ